MNLYTSYILPRLIDWAMDDKHLAPLRSELLSKASGTVAEIGFGSGANLPHYPLSVTSLIAVDTSPEILARAKKRIAAFPGEVTTLVCSGERLPIEKHSVDHVVSTFTLCSVINTSSVLTEIKRILRPGGTFLFLEHGLSPDLSVQKWQRRITPIQKRVAGGCHFDRNILGIFADACWDVPECKRFYVQGIPKIAGFVTIGTGTVA